MPEDYSSILEPPQSRKPPARTSQSVAQVPTQVAPPRQYTQPPQPAPRPVPQQIQQPVNQTSPRQVNQQAPQMVQQVLQQPAAPRAQPPAPDAVFGLFDSNEEKKVKTPTENILTNPLNPVGHQEPTAPPRDDPISKLNNIMQQMKLKEEEEQRRKAEEAKRAAAMQFQQSQFATSYAMNPMMNPYMTGMNSMGFYVPNPYMTGFYPMNQSAASIQRQVTFISKQIVAETCSYR